MLKKIFSWFTSEEVANVELFYKAREVWSYTHIDPATKRVTTKPVLVFRKASDGMFWGLLLTKTKVNGKTLYVPRLKNGKKVSVLSQMRTLKAARLVRRLGQAGDKEFGTLNSAILRLLAETQPAKPHVRAERVYRVRKTVPQYSRALTSPLSSSFAPVYILRPR